MRKTKAMRPLSLPSGRLLSWLGATILCCLGSQQAHAGRQNRPQPLSPRGSRPQQVALGARQRPAAPPAPAEIQKLQVGDLTIRGATKSEGVLATGALRWIGANTEIEVPDKASKSVMVVHADDIQASRVGKSEYGLITLSGNVRYRVVQQSSEGERVLEGTAGHAEVRRTAKRMEFTGGVRAKLTDAAHFSGPAILRTGSLIVAMDKQPYRFNLQGSAAENDIRFTPLQSAPPKTTGGKAVAPAPLGGIHIYAFRSGDLQFGEAIHLRGAGTTCEFASPDEKTVWRLQGEQFEGEFVPGTSDLQRATVTQNVRFHVTQPSTDKKTKTTADGKAPQASYVRTEAGQEMIVHGPFTINFTDPEHLEEPMLLTAEQSSTLSVKKSGDSLSYSLDDPNHTQKFHIVPKPFEANEPSPAALPIPK